MAFNFWDFKYIVFYMGFYLICKYSFDLNKIVKIIFIKYGKKLLQNYANIVIYVESWIINLTINIVNLQKSYLCCKISTIMISS